MRRSHLATFCPICRRDVSRLDISSADILSNLQTGRRRMRRSHLATLCPICRRDISRWDIPSANILPNLQTFYPICILDKMFPDGPSCLPTGPSADGTKYWQMGRPICRQARLQMGRIARWAGTSIRTLHNSIATLHCTLTCNLVML